MILFQGDKLMRLPSHTYDKNDMIRNLSVAIDDPDLLMDAEEYLKPQAVKESHASNSLTKVR